MLSFATSYFRFVIEAYTYARAHICEHTLLYGSRNRGSSLDNEQQHVAKSKRKTVADCATLYGCGCDDNGQIRLLLSLINSITYRSYPPHRYSIKIKTYNLKLLMISAIRMDNNYKSYKIKFLILYPLFFVNSWNF